jgi:hypothetical protein
MSLELGRSSAARDDDDDSESGEADDAAAESGAGQLPDEATSGAAPRRSVLAPFMIGGSADDSPPEGASGDLDEDSDDLDEDSDDLDEVSGVVVSDPGEDEARERVDAFSPAASVEEDPAAGPDDAEAAVTTDAEAAVTTDDEDAIAPRLGDEETAAASEADDTVGSGVPRQGGADDRGTFGAGSPLADAASPATAAASSVPLPRTGAAEPRLDSGGLGKAGAEVDDPLLEDAEELRTNWLRLQAGFVDDPHEAVSDAADLVEHTAQALVGALRMRQQELREMWDGGRPQASDAADADPDGQGVQPTAADTTEQLRLLMKRYRVLFNHICRS